MNEPQPPIATRDYPQLCAAIGAAIRALASDAPLEEALCGSFEAARNGLGARKALLLLVDPSQPSKRRNLVSKGLTLDEISALQHGESAPGVSSTVIASTIERREPVLVKDPRLMATDPATAAFRSENYSVLCTPIVDPHAESVLAVLYFQNSVMTDAYTEDDAEWAKTYADATGAAFGYYLQTRQRQQALNEILQNAERRDDAPDLIGESHPTEELRRLLHETLIPAANATQPDTFLITGEKGTGKSLLARYIQAYSDRHQGRYIHHSAAEISSELAASIFFGHVKGAFTGAVADTKGLFREAHRGVLFIDEIAQLPKPAQATLLRVLDSRTVRPVGGNQEIPVDVLLIVATNRNLEEAVANHEFLPDLYDRLASGHHIHLSPLRERVPDIRPLLEYHRHREERRLRKRTLGYSPDLQRALTAYAWPGNIRELEGVVMKLITYAKAGARLDRELAKRAVPQLNAPLPPSEADQTPPHLSFEDAVRNYRRDLILARIEQFDGDLRAARESLRMPEPTFRRWRRIFRINAGAGPASPPAGA